jgi:Uma2 family endonuclease
MGIRNEPLMTLEDFLAFSENAPEGVRYEVVGGSPLVMPSPTGRHQVAIMKLGFRFEAVLPEGLSVLGAPFDWVLWQEPSLTLRQPDLLVVTTEQAMGPRLTQPPLLAAEILSPTSRRTDTMDKRREYAKAGLRHYWVVDLDAPAIEALTLAGDLYTVTTTAKGPEPLTVTAPFPVTVVPDDLTPGSR